MLDAKRFHRIGHSGFHLSSAAFVECSARRRHNFGIQNSPGAIIIVLAFRADTFRSHLSFIEGIADDTAKHQLSDQDGSAGCLPHIVIGRAGVDFLAHASSDEP
jgi:hypothetical protein